MTNKELQKKIARLEAELTEVKEMAVETKRPDGGGVFKPEDGQGYWAVSMDGNIYCGVWDNHPMDHKIYAMGNCHRSHLAAEDTVRALKLIQRARETQSGFVPDWEDSTQGKYFLDFQMGDIRTTYHHSINVAPIFGFWENKLACDQFIEQNHEELTWFFTKYRGQQKRKPATHKTQGDIIK